MADKTTDTTPRDDAGNPIPSDADLAAAVKDPVPVAIQDKKALGDIPATIRFGDPLYDDIYVSYVANKGARELTKYGFRWETHQDNDHVLFVAIRQADAFDRQYSETTFRK